MLKLTFKQEMSRSKQKQSLSLSQYLKRHNKERDVILNALVENDIGIINHKSEASPTEISLQ
jgi:hypothetical protein